MPKPIPLPIRTKLGVGTETLLSAKAPDPHVIDTGIIEVLSHENVFPPDYCAEIIERHAAGWLPASITNSPKDESGREDKSYRSGNTLFISPTDDAMLFENLLAVTLKANEYYKFDLSYFDAVQLARYEEGDFYDWHCDLGPQRMGNRKLSLTVQLSSPKDYEGGRLEFDTLNTTDKENFQAPNSIGSVTVFPSFMKHKVTPVTSGTRYSVVAWCAGEHRFK